METTEIIRILRQCGDCCLTNCTECPEYQKAEEGFHKDPEAVGFMWSCGGVLLEAADRLEELTGSGDLISRDALMERIENIDWYHEDECGKSTVMRQGACSEEEAWFKAPDIFAAVRNALVVEAEPVVHAHWVMRGGRRYCSACGTRACVTRDTDDFWYTVGTKRCPECGAHMDEEIAE